MTRPQLSVLATLAVVTSACVDEGPTSSLFPDPAAFASSTDTCAPIPGYPLPVDDHGGEALE